MKKLLCIAGTATGLALLSPAAFARLEDVQATMIKLPLYTFVVFLIVVVALVYFTRIRDRRRTRLRRIFEEREAIHSVGPDAPVIECVRKMASERIGALVVMEDGKLTGIFTERDALNKVLAAGLDPGRTKVSEVMTKDPYCVPPTTTVGEAMQLISQRRFRHLPIVENGKLLGVLSSGDLTHWLVKDQVGEIKELVDVAARS